MKLTENEMADLVNKAVDGFTDPDTATTYRLDPETGKWQRRDAPIWSRRPAAANAGLVTNDEDLPAWMRERGQHAVMNGGLTLAVDVPAASDPDDMLGLPTMNFGDVGGSDSVGQTFPDDDVVAPDDQNGEENRRRLGRKTKGEFDDDVLGLPHSGTTY